MRPYYPDLEDEFAEARELLAAWVKYEPDGPLVALEMAVRCVQHDLYPLAALIDLNARRLFKVL